MSSEMKKYEGGEVEVAWNGKRVRTSKAQLSMALAPMFATFPGLKMEADTFNAYYMMLCDLDPDQLAIAVVQACQAHEYPTQLVTIAAIRKAYENEQRTPGPSSNVPDHIRRAVPDRMFRLSEEEDKRERMERLRQTKNWNY
jgi:hypothetical protein